ncbi:MAG: glycoside hydrolase family 31 protein, partial [Bacteroidota bacterium]|nr:glycoside hydrolase family 31 protein [Bacteroidota bacterium]
GVGYWTHCMGGFEQDADPELYIRWCQFGFFSPISHVFGMDHPGYKEPWNYGKEALNNFIKYDRLRYSLFPYIYSSAYELYKTGMPIIRSLVLAYQNDSNVYHIDDQYLFGNNFMVAPVVQQGQKSRTIYLPEGTWFDFWTGKKYTGKQTIEYAAALDQLPLLVKGGSIIPFQPAMNYLNEKEVKILTLEVFPEGNSSFALYEDDGKSFEYQKGGYALTKISCKETKKEIIISIASPEGNFVTPHHRYELKLHLAKAPGKITVKAGHSTKNIEIKLAEKDTGSTENSFVRENSVLYLNPGIDNSQSAEINLLK